MRGGEMASPKAWITRMLYAKAVDRMAEGVTLAKAVLDGPVFKNRKKTEKNSQIHAVGNGTQSIAARAGNERKMPMPETKK
jgi:hypothetical protein